VQEISTVIDFATRIGTKVPSRHTNQFFSDNQYTKNPSDQNRSCYKSHLCAYKDSEYFKFSDIILNSFVQNHSRNIDRVAAKWKFQSQILKMAIKEVSSRLHSSKKIKSALEKCFGARECRTKWWNTTDLRITLFGRARQCQHLYGPLTYSTVHKY